MCSLGLTIPLFETSKLANEKLILNSSLVATARSKWDLGSIFFQRLVRLFVQHNNNPSAIEFIKVVDNLLSEWECKCRRTHVCELKNCWMTPPDLLTTFKTHFKIIIEGCADPLHLTDVFPRYVSANVAHKVFGAEFDICSFEPKGSCIY